MQSATASPPAASAGRVRACRALPLAVVAFCLLGPPAAQAQTVEIVPFVGYRFFGSLTDYAGRRVSVDDDMSFGALGTVQLRPGYRAELGYSRQQTSVTLSAPFDGRQTFDVTIDQWSLGGLRDLRPGGGPITPHVAGFVGLTRASSPDEDGSTTKFMLGLGLGAKAMNASKSVGIRLDARGYFSLVGGGGHFVCGPGGCGVGLGGRSLFQMDLLAALVVGLGTD